MRREPVAIEDVGGAMPVAPIGGIRRAHPVQRHAARRAPQERPPRHRLRVDQPGHAEREGERVDGDQPASRGSAPDEPPSEPHDEEDRQNPAVRDPRQRQRRQRGGRGDPRDAAPAPDHVGDRDHRQDHDREREKLAVQEGQIAVERDEEPEPERSQKRVPAAHGEKQQPVEEVHRGEQQDGPGEPDDRDG